MIKSGYCSTTVANYGGTWLIRFVSKNYIHLWKIFKNKFRLVLHACIRFFFEKNFRCEPNMAPRSLSYVALSEEWVRKILGSMEISPSYCANLIWRKGRKKKGEEKNPRTTGFIIIRLKGKRFVIWILALDKKRWISQRGKKHDCAWWWGLNSEQQL